MVLFFDWIIWNWVTWIVNALHCLAYLIAHLESQGLVMDHIGSIFSFGSHSRNSIIVRGDVLSSSSTQESAKLHLRFESMGIWMLRQDWVAAKLDGLNLSTVSRWFYTNYIYIIIYICVYNYIYVNICVSTEIIDQSLFPHDMKRRNIFRRWLLLFPLVFICVNLVKPNVKLIAFPEMGEYCGIPISIWMLYPRENPIW